MTCASFDRHSSRASAAPQLGICAIAFASSKQLEASTRCGGIVTACRAISEMLLAKHMRAAIPLID